jgi:hypothetical protein
VHTERAGGGIQRIDFDWFMNAITFLARDPGAHKEAINLPSVLLNVHVIEQLLSLVITALPYAEARGLL